MELLVGGFDEDDLHKYGEVLTSAKQHLYCEREIKGVTDHLKGVRYRIEPDVGAELMPDSVEPA